MFLFNFIGRACENIFGLIIISALVLTILAGCASQPVTETGAVACHGDLFGFAAPANSRPLSTASVQQ